MFRHRDEMEYRRVTSGKSNFLLGNLAFIAFLGLGAGSLFINPDLIFPAVIAGGVCIVLAIISKIQRWFWS